ncbi:hypothetical protein DL93DRAFT_1178582 [Clavulina sp. PMI_390]|nr:hypothetical protein DL93DRAFT_1178582 [Clavulina sp. PMI_390]
MPHRQPRTIRQHIRRQLSPYFRKGPWSDAEDQALCKAVAELGTKWTPISIQVGRIAADCARRWEYDLRHKSAQHTGPWTLAEQENLGKIVMELTDGNALSGLSCHIPWSKVLARINHRRTLDQCRNKWERERKRLRNNGVIPRWTDLQNYYLVQQVSKLDVDDITSINWREVVTLGHEWNDWTLRETRKRFVHLMSKVLGHAHLPFKDVMAALVEKHAAPPARAVWVTGGKVKIVKKH